MSAQDEYWQRGISRRREVFAEFAQEQEQLLGAIEKRLQAIAYLLPQHQLVRYPMQMAHFLCNKENPCTHCPHIQFLRWVPNPRKLGKAIPSRVDNPGRVVRGNPEALALVREAQQLNKLRNEILGAQTQLTRKVRAQIQTGKFGSLIRGKG